MIIRNKALQVNGLIYTIRSAIETDAEELVQLRPQIDGETENLDRERGEAFIDVAGLYYNTVVMGRWHDDENTHC